MSFHISLVNRTNLSREIYRQISRAILEGRLHPGDRLPPSRELAASLRVSRMTVSTAYERLAGEGFLTSRQGDGTFVSVTPMRAAHPTAETKTANALHPRAVWDSIPVLSPFLHPAYYDFRCGLPDGSLFPHRAWRRCVALALDSLGLEAGIYGDPAGLPALRAAIARQITYSRGVDASAADIVVTNGTQQALDIIARVLLSPGDTIAVEEPGYLLPTLLFQSMNLRVVNVPVDKEGIVVSALPKRARAVYVTPSHQFPLAVPMSFSRRLALLDWAERNNSAIIEDDYDSEFRFGARPLDALRSIDSKARVIYVGSFSKTMLPTLRLGFIIAPPSLGTAVRSAKFVTDWHTSGIVQGALARFMDDGGFARHVRKMTAVYRERHQLISDIVSRDFTRHLTLLPSAAGLHAAAYWPSATPSQAARLAERAVARRIALQYFSISAVDPSAGCGIMLGYGAIPAKRIGQGLRLLRQCFDEIA